MKKTLLTAALAAFGIGAFAQTTYVGQPTDDIWVRFDNSSVKGDGQSIEVKTWTDGGVNKSFYLVQTYQFTAPESGKRVKSATLRMTTRVPRGNKATKIYGLNGIVTESSDFATVSPLVEAALAGTPIATYEMAGQNNKAIHDGGLSDDYLTVAAWQNTIDLTSYVRRLITNKFSIVFAKVNDENQSSHVYAKEVTGVKWNDAFNSGALIPDADLRPQLTVEYEDAPADGSETVNAAVDGWVMDGWQSYNGTIELKNQVYEDGGDTKTDLFYGVMRFDLPAAPAGKSLESATLRLVTERVKNDRTTNVYLLNQTVNDGDSYATLATAINDALATEPMATFQMAGNTNAIQYDKQSADFRSIAAWTNSIALSAETVKNLTSLNILITAPVQRDSKNDSNRFFSSEAVGFTNENAQGEGGPITVTTAELIPQLTLIYTSTTGVNTVKAEAQPVQNRVYYNLAGQRVERPTKGLYIVNGKKIVIK